MRRVAVVVWLVAGFGCKEHRKEAAPSPSGAAPAPIEASGDQLLTDAQIIDFVHTHRSDAWYALYLQDRKGGWANLVMRPSEPGEPGAYVAGLHLHLELSRPEGTMTYEVTDRTYYAGSPPFLLVEKRLHEQTDSGVVERRYVATADGLELTATNDGKAAPPRRLPATRDALPSMILSASAPATVRAGQRTSYATFDDDTGLDKRETLTVDRVAREIVAGVEVPVVTVSTITDEDPMPATVRIADGVALAINVGDGLRLELADRAEAQGEVEHISMLDTSVPVDRALGATDALDELTLVVGVAQGFQFPSGPHQVVTPTADGRFRITLRRVPGPAVTAAEHAAALMPTAAFDADEPAIAAQAGIVVAGATTDRARVDRIVGWVYANLAKDLSTNLMSASQVLERRGGDCTEHTLLVVALARAVGIPARPVGGLMYVDSEQRFFWHAWAQVELDGHWVAVDGAWNQSIADVGHLALDEGTGVGGSVMGSITIAAAP